MNSLAQFKQMQKEGWAKFTPLEVVTTPAAAHLVRHAAVKQGMHVLDVGCGTGVAAITAARLGATATGADLTPALLERARENARIAEVKIDWFEADVEELPFKDAEFDVVLSQFAHIFAPRPEVALQQMLRVLKPGGTIAFSTWPPELLVGTTMAISARYMPPPPVEIPPPTLWGDPTVVRQRLGKAVKDIGFDRGGMLVPALSPQHFRLNVESTAGPIVKLIAQLSASDPDRLLEFRREFDSVVSRYFRDNLVRQEFLLTRATKL
ncbi:MAG TPA: class I SAM-dependent methyltransferase [Terriglobales bacterium]|nr:class I SAM-dependent methyltransferase [Terriglobales bacterium]